MSSDEHRSVFDSLVPLHNQQLSYLLAKSNIQVRSCAIPPVFIRYRPIFTDISPLVTTTTADLNRTYKPLLTTRRSPDQFFVMIMMLMIVRKTVLEPLPKANLHSTTISR